MGILADVVDSVFFDVFTPGGRDRGLARLVADGEARPATVDGYRVRSGGDSTDEHWISLTVHGDAGPFRATVRQQLLPHPERAPLGTPVTALHHRDRVAVDWGATLRAQGVDPGDRATVLAGRTLRRPLPPGIDDARIDRRRLERGTAAEAAVVAVEPVEVFGMPTENVDLHLQLEGRAVTVRRAVLPHYAVALTVPGAILPVAVDRKDPTRVTVDWAAAAERAAA